MVKLKKLKSIAHNANRDSIWTPDPIGIFPFEHFRPKQIIVVDLITGTLKPDMEGDDVERFYVAMSKWFHQALKKEGIPIDLIESATITITPDNRTCEIVAKGRKFVDRRIF